MTLLITLTRSRTPNPAARPSEMPETTVTANEAAHQNATRRGAWPPTRDRATCTTPPHRAAADAPAVNEQLTQALNTRILIEQAKGVVAERAEVDMEQAFARLRRHARNHNLRLSDVAGAISSKVLPVSSLDT